MKNLVTPIFFETVILVLLGDINGNLLINNVRRKFFQKLELRGFLIKVTNFQVTKENEKNIPASRKTIGNFRATILFREMRNSHPEKDFLRFIFTNYFLLKEIPKTLKEW